MTQTDMVLDWMEKNGPIDQLTATIELGCTRLAARISDLKEAGIPIADEYRTNPNTGKRFKSYWLKKEPPALAEANDSKGGGMYCSTSKTITRLEETQV